MKLMHGKLSPFVRKVMIFAIEKNLEDKITIVPAAVGQGKINEELLSLNPVGKIPTLITNDDESLFDSLVICDHLDSLMPTPMAIPVDRLARTTALRLNAAAEGLVVAGVLASIERGKSPEKQWPEFEAAQWAKVNHCLQYFANSTDTLGKAFDIGTVGTICALGWVDARAPHLEWRAKFPALATWFDAMHERESVAKTRPPAP